MKKTVYKRITSVVMTLSIGLSLFGCKKLPSNDELTKAGNLTQNIEVAEVENKEIDDRFVYATADFSVNIFKESTMSDITSGKNVLISPQSIITAMSMATNGASGNTLEQLENTMYGGITIEEYNKYMQDYSGRLTADRDVAFYLANSIWIKDDDSLAVKDEFLQTCKAYYNSEVYKEPFDGGTTGKINGWASENTNHMIDSVIDQIPEEAMMYLINATSFEGEWLVQYKDTQINENGIFTNAVGNEEKVIMLNSSEGYYLQDDMARGFIKYYKGGNYAFVGMVPNEGITIEEYVSKLDGKKLIETYNNRSYLGDGNVIVTMPEFTYEYDREMSNDFKALGATDAFEGDKADLSAMAHSDAGNLYISRVLHKTYIQHDRNGTKAAAVTTVEIDNETCAAPCEVEIVTLDRPFYYAIIDCKTGLPVFMGVVNSVN